RCLTRFCTARENLKPALCRECAIHCRHESFIVDEIARALDHSKIGLREDSMPTKVGRSTRRYNHALNCIRNGQPFFSGTVSANFFEILHAQRPSLTLERTYLLMTCRCKPFPASWCRPNAASRADRETPVESGRLRRLGRGHLIRGSINH